MELHKELLVRVANHCEVATSAGVYTRVLLNALVARATRADVAVPHRLRERDHIADHALSCWRRGDISEGGDGVGGGEAAVAPDVRGGGLRGQPAQLLRPEQLLARPRAHRPHLELEPRSRQCQAQPIAARVPKRGPPLV